ncbi:hypothetical protein, partial [Vibrio parahaemolyticus]|uniref:hypothetical protein n=1 Tax=Vibrio parahaemolyticus TaxID=670 RepID=UPI00402B72D1
IWVLVSHVFHNSEMTGASPRQSASLHHFVDNKVSFKPRAIILIVDIAKRITHYPKSTQERQTQNNQSCEGGFSFWHFMLPPIVKRL